MEIKVKIMNTEDSNCFIKSHDNLSKIIEKEPINGIANNLQSLIFKTFFAYKVSKLMINPYRIEGMNLNKITGSIIRLNG